MQMPYPILTTRLRKPEITSDLLPRTRLIRKLNNSISLPFTLVSAGAGYGKSVLVSQWLEQVDSKYVWLSCVVDMNNIKIFLTYLIKGIKNVASANFDNTLALLEGPIEVPSKTLFHHFISELDSIQERLILVFDDFHSLRNTAIIDLIETLLKYPLPTLHIFILTRRDPAINLYQYKLKNSIAEFRMKDLHFTRTEIKEYAKSQFDIYLDPYEIKELKEKTEGWILGLKGALMIYQKSKSNDRLKGGLIAQDFKDLFFNEIIFKQEETLQTALFISSLFDRFCEQMLNFILKGSNHKNLPFKNIIREFERNNFFIISLDNQKEWYRFHHQFQVVLKEFLSEKISEGEVNKYLQLGSSWLIENGYYEEGIENAINTDDPAFSLQLFVKIKNALLNSDQYNRLKYLLEIFPESWQDIYPELVITKALILEIQGKYNAIPAIIEHFEKLAENEKTAGNEQVEYLLLKGMMLYYSGKFKESYHSFEKSISLNTSRTEYTYTLALSNMAFALNNTGQKEKAFQILNIYLDSLAANKNFARGRVYAALAFLHGHNGELNEIDRLLPYVIELSSIHKHYITLSYGLYLKAMLCYYWNKFDDCNHIFKKSYENRFRMRPTYFLSIWGIKALFHLKRNESELLKNTLTEIDEFVFIVEDYYTEHLQKCFLTEIALQRGEIKKATEIGNNTNFFPYIPAFLFFIPQFTLLKLLLHSDNPENNKQYHKIKDRLEEFARETHHQAISINLNLLNALEYHRSGNEHKAVRHLMNALELTSSENNVMIYTEYGDELNELLNKLPDVIREQKHEKNIDQLFKEIKSKSLSEETNASRHEIVLSGRDIKILKMVSKGHKNNEIAQSMYLSPESIKKYLYEIFQKLEVNNRIKAVVKATELGLID